MERCVTTLMASSRSGCLVSSSILSSTRTYGPRCSIRALRSRTSTRSDSVALFLGLRYKQDGKYWWPLLKEKRAATTRSFAKGLSNLMVFDYITSNWDRFSLVEPFFGANAHFDDGRFLALDNGAAFHVLTQQRTQESFGPVGRFSRTFIASIRAMRPQGFDDLFFPDPSKEASERIANFWRQRDRLIARVDALVKEHGQDAVFALD